MRNNPTGATVIRVDPSNPGQYFACCGLLELADRMFPGASAAFSKREGLFSFDLRLPTEDALGVILANLSACTITSSLTNQQIVRLKQLLNTNKKTISKLEADEKHKLGKLWKREQIRFNEPYNLWVDWWTDNFTGGDAFKTWAGKQFVIDIVRGMQTAFRNAAQRTGPGDLFSVATNDGSLPFYFDSDIGGHSMSMDVGFSLDALKIRAITRPAIELLSFIGLQRVRPMANHTNRTFTYTLWSEQLPPLLAAVTACGMAPTSSSYHFEFRLLYRTDYLKAFLPAKTKPT